VGHWTFDGKDMTSNVADISGNGNNGFLAGQTSTTTVIGKIGQALEFDGSNDYVNVPHSAELSPSVVTMAAWIKIPESTGDHETIVSKFDAVSAFDGYMLSIGNGGSQGLVAVWDGDGWNVGVGSVDDGDWHHVVGIVDTASVSYYIDGSFDASDVTTPTLSQSAELHVGNRTDNGFSGEFDGLIDDVRVYNRVLSAEEVSRLYDLGR